jgi:hypothetical protein
LLNVVSLQAHPLGRKIFRPYKLHERQSAVDKGWQIEEFQAAPVSNAAYVRGEVFTVKKARD